MAYLLRAANQKSLDWGVIDFTLLNLAQKITADKKTASTHIFAFIAMGATLCLSAR